MKKLFKVLIVVGIVGAIAYAVKRKLDADREWAEAIDRELAATDLPSGNSASDEGAVWSSAPSEP